MLPLWARFRWISSPANTSPSDAWPHIKKGHRRLLIITTHGHGAAKVILGALQLGGGNPACTWTGTGRLAGGLAGGRRLQVVPGRLEAMDPAQAEPDYYSSESEDCVEDRKAFGIWQALPVPDREPNWAVADVDDVEEYLCRVR